MRPGGPTPTDPADHSCVWAQSRNGKDDIAVYNGSAGTIRYTTSTNIESQPAVSGSKVVYTQRLPYTVGTSGTNCVDGVTVWDLLTDSKWKLGNATEGVLQASPSIDGNLVTFLEGTHVRIWNLATKSCQALVSGTATKATPRISGKRIVFLADSGGTNDVWVYDIATSRPSA